MNLTEKQKEQLTVALQAAVFAAFAGAALIQEGRLYRKYRKKILAENASQEEKLTKEIARAKGMLSNERFVSKAPEAKVQEEKEKLEKYTQMLANVQERMKGLAR